MSMTMVSRRVMNIKVKRTSKPRVPLPRRSTSDEMVGEKAKPFVMRAAAPRVEAPRAWWQKAIKPAAICAGILVCAGFGYLLSNASSRSSYERTTEVRSAPVPTVSFGRQRGVTLADGMPGQAISENIALSNRPTPDERSFRASGYVRSKVALPNISGNCVVRDRGEQDVGACLRRQMEQQ